MRHGSIPYPATDLAPLPTYTIPSAIERPLTTMLPPAGTQVAAPVFGRTGADGADDPIGGVDGGLPCSAAGGDFLPLLNRPIRRPPVDCGRYVVPATASAQYRRTCP